MEKKKKKNECRNKVVTLRHLLLLRKYKVGRKKRK